MKPINYRLNEFTAIKNILSSKFAHDFCRLEAQAKRREKKTNQIFRTTATACKQNGQGVAEFRTYDGVMVKFLTFVGRNNSVFNDRKVER